MVLAVPDVHSIIAAIVAYRITYSTITLSLFVTACKAKLGKTCLHVLIHICSKNIATLMLIFFSCNTAWAISPDGPGVTMPVCEVAVLLHV